MKNILLLLFISLSFSTITSAQEITMKSGFGGIRFYQDGAQYRLKNILSKVEANPEAYALMQKGKSGYILASIISGAGGALIGWPLGTSLGGGEPNWNLALVGAGLFVASIPISSSAIKKMKSGVQIYNQGLSTGFYENPKPQIDLLIRPNGLGLSLWF